MFRNRNFLVAAQSTTQVRFIFIFFSSTNEQRPKQPHKHSSMWCLGHTFILNLNFILNLSFIPNLKVYLSLRRSKEGQGNLKNSPKVLINQHLQKIKSSVSPHVSRNSIRSGPCFSLHTSSLYIDYH